MKNWRKCIPLLALPLLLCGCGRDGIGSKNILRGVYLEREAGKYQVRLVCFQASPAADAGEAQEQSILLRGSGDTAFEAVQAARESRGGELFSGLNELLLIGPELARAPLEEQTGFFAHQQAGRPNTGVFLTDLPLKALDAPSADAGAMLSAVELVRARGTWECSLYQLWEQRQAVLPVLHIGEDLSTAVQDGAVLFRDGVPAVRWDAQQTALAMLLTGQSRRARFQIPGAGAVSFLADSVRMSFEAGEGPVLHITLRGDVRRVQTAAGTVPEPEREHWLPALNSWLEAQAAGLIGDTFEAGADVFGFESRLRVRDAAAVEALQKAHALTGAGRVTFQSRLERF